MWETQPRGTEIPEGALQIKEVHREDVFFPWNTWMSQCGVVNNCWQRFERKLPLWKHQWAGMGPKQILMYPPDLVFGSEMMLSKDLTDWSKWPAAQKAQWHSVVNVGAILEGKTWDESVQMLLEAARVQWHLRQAVWNALVNGPNFSEGPAAVMAEPMWPWGTQLRGTFPAVPIPLLSSAQMKYVLSPCCEWLWRAMNTEQARIKIAGVTGQELVSGGPRLAVDDWFMCHHRGWLVLGCKGGWRTMVGQNGGVSTRVRDKHGVGAADQEEEVLEGRVRGAHRRSKFATQMHNKGILMVAGGSKEGGKNTQRGQGGGGRARAPRANTGASASTTAGRNRLPTQTNKPRANWRNKEAARAERLGRNPLQEYLHWLWRRSTS